MIGALDEFFPRRVAEAIFHQAGVPLGSQFAELSNTERAALVEAAKALAMRVSGSRGFAKAEVTAGGVALDEVDSRTMQSKRVRESLSGRRDFGLRRFHRRLQFSSRLQHRLAGRRVDVPARIAIKAWMGRVVRIFDEPSAAIACPDAVAKWARRRRSLAFVQIDHADGTPLWPCYHEKILAACSII